jgi:hypothetical protein
LFFVADDLLWSLVWYDVPKDHPNDCGDEVCAGKLRLSGAILCIASAAVHSQGVERMIVMDERNPVRAALAPVTPSNR